MQKALVIYNPVSGAKKWRNVPELIKEVLVEFGYEWTWHNTVPCQNLKPLFEGKFDRIVVAGGDGTVAEIVGALVQENIKVPLVVLPQGSGNLLARALGIPVFQMRRALTLGLSAQPHVLDVMRVNGRHYGVIAVGRGLDTFLMQKTPRALKRKLGLFAYFWVFCKTFFLYRSQPYKITLDSKRIQVLAKTIMVFNVFPLPLSPVNPQDGLINTFVWTSKNHLLTFSSKTVVIKAKKEFKFQVDGEVFRGKVAKVEIVSKALSIVY